MRYLATSKFSGQRVKLDDSDAFHRWMIDAMKKDPEHWELKQHAQDDEPENKEDPLWEIYLKQSSGD